MLSESYHSSNIRTIVVSFHSPKLLLIQPFRHCGHNHCNMSDSTVSTILAKTEVTELLYSILRERNLLDYELKISSGSSKGDGYQSFVTSVEVVDGNFNVIIKCAPSSVEFRALTPVRHMYMREILFYEKIVPSFETTQGSMENRLNYIPKCYKCISDNGNEKLVLENIKVQGFKLWNSKLQMDKDHIAIVFEHYGKFHAISYALRDQYPDEFHELTKDLTSTWALFSEITDFMKLIRHDLEQASLMVGRDNSDIATKIHDISRKIERIMCKSQLPGTNTVITHGDARSNNVLFKYNDPKNPGKPTDLRFIDFQAVGHGSPIIDLVYFFYPVADKTHLDNLKDYQHIYYQSLSNHTKALGTDINKYLTFDEFINQWKKYSKFGFVISPAMIRDSLKEEDEFVDSADVDANGVDFVASFGNKIKNEDQYIERITNVALHMYENGFI